MGIGKEIWEYFKSYSEFLGSQYVDLAFNGITLNIIITGSQVFVLQLLISIGSYPLYLKYFKYFLHLYFIGTEKDNVLVISYKAVLYDKYCFSFTRSQPS